MQATLDFCADKGWLVACINIVNLMQMTCQGRWVSDSDLLTMPHLDTKHLTRFFNNKQRIDCLPRLVQICEQHNCQNVLENLVGDLMDKNQIKQIYEAIKMLPIIDIKISIAEMSDENTDKCSKIQIDTENDNKLYDLYENEEYVIDFDLSYRNLMEKRAGAHTRNRKAYAPRYPKEKDENWIVLIGANCQSEYNNELIALKRINSIHYKHQSAHMLIKTPLKSDLVSEDGSFMLSIYLMSDVYIGLDQQYNIKLNLKSKNS
jgi:activating signal cointegrator complex subunit 3